LDLDSAGDGVDLHSTAGISHARPQTVLVLIFDDDRNSRIDLTGHCLCRKMEIRRRRDGDFDASGGRLQIPIAIALRISLHRHAS